MFPSEGYAIFFWKDATYMSIDYKMGAHERPKYGYQQSPSYSSESYWACLENVINGLFTAGKMTQKELQP